MIIYFNKDDNADTIRNKIHRLRLFINSNTTGANIHTAFGNIITINCSLDKLVLKRDELINDDYEFYTRLLNKSIDYLENNFEILIEVDV